jgi:hypothetical protein
MAASKLALLAGAASAAGMLEQDFVMNAQYLGVAVAYICMNGNGQYNGENA